MSPTADLQVQGNDFRVYTISAISKERLRKHAKQKSAF